MKFKLTAGLILFFCSLYFIEAKQKIYNDRHCLASVYNLRQQLAFCHGRFVCDYYHGHPYQCIKKDSICDGTLDCPGGEDEFNCPKKVTKCEVHQIKCPTNDRCAISCNGVPECDYGIDEKNCVPTCKEDEVICQEGTCARICDGKRQCKNGIDETDCRPKVCEALPKNVENGKFKSVSGSGIVGDSAVLVCNLRYSLYPETLDFVSITCQPDGKWSTPGEGRCLSTKNLALNQQTSESSIRQKSTDGMNTDGTNAVDGDRTTRYFNLKKPTCFHSGLTFLQPWWEVQFGQEHPIAKVEITIRLSENVEEFKDIVVFVKRNGMPDQICGGFPGPADTSQSQIIIKCDSVLIGDAVRIQKTTSDEARLVLCEVEVYTFMYKV